MSFAWDFKLFNTLSGFLTVSLTPSFLCIEATSCLPSPCRRLSRPRTTMETPLPCRIFRGFPHSRFRHSGLGNPRLVRLQLAHLLSDVDSVRFLYMRLAASNSYPIYSTNAYGRSRYGVHSCFPPQAQQFPLGLPFRQLGFHPCADFMSHHSVVAQQLANSWLFLHAIFPFGFPRQVSG